MSINSSSSPSLTFDPLHLLQSNSSNSSFYLKCSQSIGSLVLYSIFMAFNTLFLLPLCIFIIYTGYQRWRRQNTTSCRSDLFTYHIAAVEICGAVGSFFHSLGIYTRNWTLFEVGVLVPCVIFPGQTLFHCLTCLEHYLAVVHPVSFRRLRDRGGVRVRSIMVGCVWLLCFGWIGLTEFYYPGFPAAPLLCLFLISIIFISFCCLSVLFALTHPGPGDVGGDKERVAQSKQRAFFIIGSIFGALLLRFLGVCGILGLTLYLVESIPMEVLCALIDFGLCLTIPSSLVLPLLFLHKTGQLVCCRHRTVS